MSLTCFRWSCFELEAEADGDEAEDEEVTTSLLDRTLSKTSPNPTQFVSLPERLVAFWAPFLHNAQ